MPTYEFSFILSGFSLRDNEPADALYEMYPDSTLSGWQGQVLMDLRLAAETALDALRQGRAGVEMVVGVHVVALHEDLVGVPDIATRTERSDESIRQHVRGLRGDGHFPPAVGVLKGGTMVWRWSEIAPKLREMKLMEDSGTSFIDSLSAAVFAVEFATSQSQAITILEWKTSGFQRQRAPQRAGRPVKNSQVDSGILVTPRKVAASKKSSVVANPAKSMRKVAAKKASTR